MHMFMAVRARVVNWLWDIIPLQLLITVVVSRGETISLINRRLIVKNFKRFDYHAKRLIAYGCPWQHTVCVSCLSVCLSVFV